MLNGPRAKPTIAVLAAVTVPLPLHAVGQHRHRQHPRRHGASAVHRKVARAPTRSRPGRSRPRHGSSRRGSRASSNLGLALTLHHGRRARAAADPSDTISDFKFAPATITVHVGDTITWTNLGPSDHTATASNGSFNTGVLKKGASASHTFTQAGTFTYICQIHPFMHGTVVVVGNSSATTSPSTSAPSSAPPTSNTQGASASSSGPAPATATQPTQSSGPTLPLTGLDLIATGALAVAMLGAGVLLRRSVGRRS